MTTTQLLIMISLIVLGTAITRFLPFILFPAGRKTPEYVQYLGRVLPGAAIGMLLVYCLKAVNVLAFPYGLPELIALACVILLHLWKRQVLLSIAAGTIVYMLLLQFVF